MNILIGRLLALCVLLSPAAGAQRISLDQAIADGLRLNPTFQNRALDRESADLRLERSEKNRRFRLDAQTGYLYKSDTMLIETPGITLPGVGSVPGSTIEAGLHHSFDLNLRLTQPIYTGGVLALSTELEAVGQAVAANQEELELNSITGRIKLSYFQHRFLVKRRETLASFGRTLELHRARLELLVSEGLARRTDLLETHTRIEENRIRITEVEDTIERERIHFFALCGHNPEEIEPDYREGGLDLQSSITRFRESHPVIKTLNSRIRGVALQERILAGRYKPQVRAFAEAHYGKPGLDYFKKEWSAYLQGGITVDWALFDWNKRKEDGALLLIETRRLENQRRQYIKDITESIEQLFATLDSLNRQLDHVERLLEYSGEDARLKSELYSEKQIPNIDYLTALEDKNRHRIQRADLRIRMEQVKVRINTLIGPSKEDQP